MGNKESYEAPDSYLYDPVKDFENDESLRNFQLKYFPILHPTNEVLEETKRIEKEILKLSDLEVDKEIWIEDIHINFYGDNYLHTIRAQESKENLNKKKPTMIMVHGFMASCSHYIKMLKFFFKDYNIFAIDLIGMGFSSRPQPKFQDSKEYINFFVDSIEAFRMKIFKDYTENDNKKIYLIGHSLGGYICTNYSIKYPKYIIKLFLLSPVGITDMKNNTEEDNDGSTMGRKIVDSIICLIWPLKTTFQNLINSNFMFKNFLKGGLLNRYTISQEERELYRDLTFHTLTNYPKDLDGAIYYILKLPLPMAIWPLENVMLSRIKDFSVDIIYGKNDWMEYKGALRMCEKDKYEKFNIYFIRGGRHTFNLEKPVPTSQIILQGIEKEFIRLKKSENLNLNAFPNSNDNDFLIDQDNDMNINDNFNENKNIKFCSLLKEN